MHIEIINPRYIADKTINPDLDLFFTARFSILHTIGKQYGECFFDGEAQSYRYKMSVNLAIGFAESFRDVYGLINLNAEIVLGLEDHEELRYEAYERLKAHYIIHNF